MTTGTQRPDIRPHPSRQLFGNQLNSSTRSDPMKNNNLKQQNKYSLTRSTKNDYQKDQLQMNKLNIKSNGILDQQIFRSQIKDSSSVNDCHGNLNGKKKKKFLSYTILILIFILLLCALIIPTIIISLKKPSTSIITAETETTSAIIITRTTTTTVSTTTTTTLVPLETVFWSFDNNTNDMYNKYNGVALNAPSYITGYTGLNSKALSFNKSLSQYVIVNGSYFNFTYRSFTVELWFYPTFLPAGDYGLFGQCDTTSTSHCLIYMIRNNKLLLAFYGNDLAGTTMITINQWYHVAFVYDYSTSTQYLYLNGFLQGNRPAGLYQGKSGPITIGSIKNGGDYYFNGYVDQVLLVTRAKTASEVLYDATTVCYYPFDSNSSYDFGPLGLNGSSIGLSFAPGMGRINDGISFTSSNSYFLSGGMTTLGTTNDPYSFAIWIKPTLVNNSVIVYVSKCNNNCALNWCMPFIGFTSTGQIAIQSWSSVNNGTIVILTGPNLMTNTWTHVVHTYSPTNGMRLYLNGLLYSQSSAFTYMASNSPNYIYLGSFPLTTCDAVSSIISTEQFYGLLDEFYLFSREITATDISNLANP